ncbi:MAG TPA: NUDIX domain-containing protein [Firmicutes bacterium]|nr:NUDIX domain-containing protein [Bacillota bacterium]
MNTQSGAGELWDVYDRNRNKTGRLHRRGDDLPEGDYHIVVHVWMQNSRGEYLLTKRSPNKGYPNMWETTGGSALAGDDSLTAALREVHEETGLTLDPSRGKRIFEFITRDTFVDVWLFLQDFSLDDIVLQEGETCGARYVVSDELRALSERGELVPYRYLDRLLDDISM